MAKLCIDLCSGLGGFSRAFVDAGWEVITVDIDPEFNPTICADVRELSVGEIWGECRGGRDDYSKVVVVASPPCQRFSHAPHEWPMKGIRKALEIVGACLELIVEIKPHYWILENPQGYLYSLLQTKPSMKLFLGDYKKETPKRTHFWSNFLLPLVTSETPRRYQKIRGGQRWDRLNNNESVRAKMPYGLSQAVLEAVSQ